MNLFWKLERHNAPSLRSNPRSKRNISRVMKFHDQQQRFNRKIDLYWSMWMLLGSNGVNCQLKQSKPYLSNLGVNFCKEMNKMFVLISACLFFKGHRFSNCLKLYLCFRLFVLFFYRDKSDASK